MFGANPLYKEMIMDVAGHEPNGSILWGIPAYGLMVLALNLFCVPQIDETAVLKTSAIYGGCMGLVIYGVFDTTCAFIFQKWHLKVIIIEIPWGCFVYFISTFIGAKVFKADRSNMD